MRLSLSLLGVVAALALSAPAYAQSRYTFIQLGAPSGWSSGAYGVNDQGHVTGITGPTGTGTSRAFFWADVNGDRKFQLPEMTILGTFGGSSSFAKAINRFDQVVGRASLPVNAEGKELARAFVWKPGDTALTDLNTRLTGVPEGESWELWDAYAITDAGAILARGKHTVEGSGSVPYDRPCVLVPSAVEPGRYTLLNIGAAFPADSSIQAVQGGGLNAQGQAVVRDNQSRSFYWSGADLTQMDVTAARTLNNAGAIVGTSQTMGAFYKSSPVAPPEPIGSSSSSTNPWAINDAGQVVGEIYPVRANSTGRAFRWQRGGTLIDLNGFLAKGTKFTLTTAYANSGGGLIVGLGTDGRTNYAYVLIPAS